MGEARETSEKLQPTTTNVRLSEHGGRFTPFPSIRIRFTFGLN